jgi:ABC-type sugar transport system ATPase subunit
MMPREMAKKEDHLLLKAEGLWKTFGATIALRGINFELGYGEIRGLVGANGAGKSVFSKIIAGILQPDAGDILWKGKKVRFRNVREAREAGINIVQQEETLVPDLNVADNIFLGLYKKRIINKKKLLEEAREFIHEKFGVKLDASKPVRELEPVDRKIVEISRALVTKSDLIIFDESTAHLSEIEKAKLYQIIKELSAHNIGIIFISHDITEVLKISSTVTVLVNGMNVGTLKSEEVTLQELERMMFGEISKYSAFRSTTVQSTKKIPFFSVRNLTGYNINGISFDLHEGEILGITGLRNQGQRELLLTIYGSLPIKEGEILIQGRRVDINSPKNAIKNGIVYITDKREEEGIFPLLSILRNLSLGALDSLTFHKFFVDQNKERNLAENLTQKFRIKGGSLDQAVISLSGGNKQKVIFARMFAIEPKIVLLSYPTIGIDLATKSEIYSFLDEVKRQKKLGIILYTDDYEELLKLCDRVMFMHEGKIKGIYDAKELDLNKISQVITT